MPAYENSQKSTLNKSRYNMYRGWTRTNYRNKHYNINRKDEGSLDDRGRDGGINFILRIKEQETRLTLQERDDDNEVCEIKISQDT